MIVLDTHVWYWWLSDPDKLSKKAKRAVDRADRVGLPAICVWEVAMKAASGRLKFDVPYPIWIEAALSQDSRTELLELSPRIAILAAQLGSVHRDPADKLIAATAIAYESPLITGDAAIRGTKSVRCIWD